ncbi:hypothetical protein CEXT_4971 [Caerostris extrusa]|uniref:Uncharacterized protein n=1 Tax=Caerostris extrusa TaxID=172846 RepID=A0AAV4WA48_CAEEX|nr:hypothetical protein CEXT_4971 [Caerostris extrusa]
MMAQVFRDHMLREVGKSHALIRPLAHRPVPLWTMFHFMVNSPWRHPIWTRLMREADLNNWAERMGLTPESRGRLTPFR